MGRRSATGREKNKNNFGKMHEWNITILKKKKKKIEEEITHITAKIRPLLKKKTTFLWLEERQEAFQTGKRR